MPTGDPIRNSEAGRAPIGRPVARARHPVRVLGILYNHESERRPEYFVTRKITRSAAAIKLGMAEEMNSATCPQFATGRSPGM